MTLSRALIRLKCNVKVETALHIVACLERLDFRDANICKDSQRLIGVIAHDGN